MSEVIVKIKRMSYASEIFVDGRSCGLVSDYGDENSATSTHVIERLIGKLNIDNIKVIEEDKTKS